ncbi:MAG: hypothetical protein HY904_19380 [Deltaproteobacteria bacterium]|nr:hypothetical protein [Deltaproteobacteria bacterium]
MIARHVAIAVSFLSLCACTGRGTSPASSSTGGAGSSSGGAGSSTGGAGSSSGGAGSSSASQTGSLSSATGAPSSGGASGVLSSSSGLSGGGASSAAGSSGTAAPQPVLITFDLHMDPLDQNASVDQRRSTYQAWLNNAVWLLDTFEPYGVRISLLSTGEWLEFCQEDAIRCYPVLRRFRASGGILGTHIHEEIRQAQHDWPNLLTLRGGAAQITADDVQRNWHDTKAVVDAVAAEAFALTAAEVAAVNTAGISHLPDTHSEARWLHEILASLAYTIKEGGAEQEMVPFFGHVPVNPFRPGNCNICEDPAVPVIALPQSAIPGTNQLHFGVLQDARTPRKQVEILQTVLNQQLATTPRVYTYGWGCHGHDLAPSSDTRTALLELIPWISAELAPGGMAAFASYPAARDAFLAWEADHPGVSSFDYSLATADYTAYPYDATANHYLRYAHYVAKIADGVHHLAAFPLDSSARYPLVLVMAGGTGSTDVSGALGTSPVRAVRLGSGLTASVDPRSVPLDGNAWILCEPAACDAILALEAWLTHPPCGSSSTPCSPGTVCEPGRSACSPDCREPIFSCPPQRPVCNPSSGVCGPADGGLPPPPDGGLPPPSDGGPPSCAAGEACPPASVCCTAPAPCAGRCVPDCRSPGNACPAQRPTCNTSTGMCGP